MAANAMRRFSAPPSLGQLEPLPGQPPAMLGPSADALVLRRQGRTSSQTALGLERRRATIDAGVVSGALGPRSAGGPKARSSSSARAAAAAAQNLLSLDPLDRPPPPEGPAASVNAAVLAKRHRLELHEVQSIVTAFDGEAPVEAKGIYPLKKQSFHKVLCKVFRVPKISGEVLNSAYEFSIGDGKVDINKFMAWYVLNMFTTVNSLNADASRGESDELVYNLARQHGVTTMVIDKIKQKFDHFDTDKSGEIEHKEFQDMMVVILKATSISQLSEDRIKKFWREIDKDGNGRVSFSEFTEWYLKYFFNKDAGVDDYFSSTKLTENFYDSYNPTVQRRLSVDVARRASM